MTPHAPSKFGMPFRLGCTSYVYAADILPNVEKMAPIVDDIELVLFESSEVCNFPDEGVIAELARLAEVYGNTYTVHFPTDKRAGSTDRAERAAFVEQVRKVVAVTNPIRPFAYVMHLEGVFSSADEARRKEWYNDVRGVCSAIQHALGPHASSAIAVETLEYTWTWMKPLVEDFGLHYCIDMGHAWLYGHDWQAMLRDALPATTVIHLHGVVDGADHQSLARHDVMQTAVLLGLLIEAGYRNVVTLEVFNERDTFESIDAMRRLWAESRS